MKRRVVLQDVARAAGVSVGTVSNVMNNPQRVSPDRRERVFAAMRTLGYRPPGFNFPRELLDPSPPAVEPADDSLPLLVCAGYVSVDYIARVEVMPHRHDRTTAEHITKELGGPAANVAVAAAALDGGRTLNVDLATAIGSDPDSRWALERLAERGVRARAIRDPFRERLSRCIVLVESDGQRTIVNEPLALSGADLVDIPERSVATSACHLHVDGYQAESLLSALPTLQERGWTTSLHPTGMPPRLRSDAGIRSLLSSVDTLFLDRQSVAALLGRRYASDALITAFGDYLSERDRHAEVVVTLGLDGAVVWPVASDPLRARALPVEVQDRTGAGDCFVGVFLAQRLCGETQHTAARRAAAAASLSIAADGAQGRRSTREHIDHQLAGHDT